MTETTILQHQGFMRLPEILKLLPIGKTTWWEGVKSGSYPKAYKLRGNTTAWKREDIMKLLESFHAAA